ncbi:polyprenyl synthetase family protein [Blastochloris tepida]|jgi:farnesyl diphosphate synthase|uniref:Probable farnesyl diphosphate synthase n=1 Tax=Blastochloris tepida TaxID=2233851 RepID=A0A348G5F3_9HYPH|nr:farnesyl diphosphate synthase [Blastochloris tepida]BBF94786.1 geranylgeranyl pyrophosphate synthase [Blastochloris tepida]
MSNVISPAAFSARLADVAAATETALETLLADGPEAKGSDRLVAAMRYGALAGGKRFRPFLVIETAALFGVPLEAAMPTACALELVHCYSLVHDDLPAMDNDALRRGRPTTHIAFDEATAILAGDALMTLAFDVLASETAHPDPAVRVALVLGLARNSGVGGMAGGQMRDLAAEGRFAADRKPLALSEAEVLELQAMKTGALLAYACHAGALIGGASAAETAALAAYSNALGVAFQIADDLLDAEGDAATTGKAVGKDATLGKATLISLMGTERAHARLEELVGEAAAALAPFGARAGMLAAAARFVADRKA